MKYATAISAAMALAVPIVQAGVNIAIQCGEVADWQCTLCLKDDIYDPHVDGGNLHGGIASTL